MGGYGSGRRERVINLSAFLRLDTFKLALPAPSGTAIAQQWTWADGSSISICANRDSLDLNFHEVDSQHKSIPVSQWMRLSWMPCHLGGMRFYVRCPHCHERARYLYCCGGLFICRKCTGRGYRSQNKNTDSRLCNGIAKLQRRLAGVKGELLPRLGSVAAARYATAHLPPTGRTPNKIATDSRRHFRFQNRRVHAAMGFLPEDLFPVPPPLSQ